jgi:thiol-disulfide isomerase/thioredoxin
MTRPAYPRIAAAVVLAAAIAGCADDAKKSTAPDTGPPPGTTGDEGAVGTPGRGSPNRPTANAGNAAVTVKTGDFKLVEQALAAAKGKVVLVDCWATWCGPCVASFPKLVEKHQAYGDKGLVVMSVSVDKADKGAEVLAFLREHNATFTNIHLKRDEAAQKAMVEKFAYKGSIPHAVLFNKAGQRVWAGHPMDPKLTGVIDAELARPYDPSASPASPAGGFPGSSGEVAVRPVRFDGVEKAIADAKGKVILIDCWATWCGPCVASFPKLVEKHQKYHAKGLAVISLSLDQADKGAEVLAFLKKNNAAFTNLHLLMDDTAEQALVSRFAFKGGIPHAVLLNRAGQRVWAGHPMDTGLEAKIQAELAKSDDAAASGPSAPGSGEVAVKQVRFDGVESALADAKGKVVLIDCWATWCGPCVASFPKLVEKHEQYADKGLAVISLSTDKAADANKVIDFLKRNRATFLNLHLPLDAAAAKSLQEKFAYKNAIPHAVLFSKTGERVWAGHPMDKNLTALIEAELAK